MWILNFLPDSFLILVTHAITALGVLGLLIGTKVIKEKGKLQIEYVNRLVKGDTVEIVKDMSEEERQAFLVKQKELQDALKNCPVPKIIVEEHNQAAEKK